MMQVTKDDSEAARWRQLLWTDLAGVRRSRCVVSKSDSDCGSVSCKVATVCFALPAYADVAVSVEGTALPFSGEYVVMGDERTDGFPIGDSGVLTVLGSVLGETSDGPAFVCSRSVLARACAAVEADTGLRVNLGFELEFVLLRSSGAPDALRPVDDDVYATSNALGARMGVLLSMTAALRENGIEVVQFHGESAPGQFELALQHYGALEAVDKLTVAKEVVVHVARAHGLVASFLPKPSASAAGSGCHCHVGLVGEVSGENAFGMSSNSPSPSPSPSAAAPGLTPLGEAFMAGVVAHLPALPALTMGTANSYLRVAPHCWAGAFQCWGFENREAPVRLVAAAQGGPATNFEIKAFDCAANPYVGAAACIYAGLDGVRRRLTLGAPCEGDPAKLEVPPPPMPASGVEAARNLAADEDLSDLLGADLVRLVCALREADHDFFKDMALEKQASLLLQRF